jgi:hypothetical protein
VLVGGTKVNPVLEVVDAAEVEVGWKTKPDEVDPLLLII